MEYFKVKTRTNLNDKRLQVILLIRVIKFYVNY